MIGTQKDDTKTIGAHVLINCDSNEREVLFDRIGKIENVAEIKNISGSYDIIAKIIANNSKSSITTITDELNKIVNINSVVTLFHKDCGHPDKNKNCLDTIFDNTKNNGLSVDYDFTCCQHCGLQLTRCHCVCLYCGERDDCECALFDAATGG